MGADVIDLDGLVLAPGFIDIHTHYDAQVLWDPDLTPSCWHGVTTVIMGNCGFGIAPTRPADRETIARTLENVEGMSAEALQAGIPWTFETFPEYLEILARTSTRLNVGALIGHTPVRLYVLGQEGVQRSATAAEVGQMRAVVNEALRHGAVGFATSKAPVHVGAHGQPVPSRYAELDEIFGIADALRETGRGIVQVTVGPGLYVKQLAALSQRIGRPVTWAALFASSGSPSAAQVLDRQASLGGEVWPQISNQPVVMQVTLADPFPFAAAPAFAEILSLPRPRRARLYADAAWRERARREVGTVWDHWARTTVQETDRHPELLNGPSLAVLAAQRGADPLDLMIDLSLDEGLRTRFRVVLANDDQDQLGQLLKDRRTLLGLSDAGAHASQLCDAGFSTYLLGHWVREAGALTLEEAVWRLTGQPAQVFGLEDRGRIAPGFAADLVAFDPNTIRLTERERVWDLPAGADRLIVRSHGIHGIWVNGEATRLDGKDLDGVRAGKLLRGAES
jgi:N-acyl-D-aspartate/D-glutamate deacylase